MQKKIIVQNKFGVIKKQFGSKFFYQKFFLNKNRTNVAMRNVAWNKFTGTVKYGLRSQKF